MVLERINYLLELYPDLGNANPIGDRSTLSQTLQIFVIELKRYTNTYWTTWGGFYDNPETKKIQLFVGVQLQEVSSQAALLTTVNSFWIDGDFAYMHLPKPNYLYEQTEVRVGVVEFYTTATLSKTPLKSIFLDGELYETLLDIPSVNTRLSDDFSGLVVQQTFTVALDNSDGAFDFAGDSQVIRYFNAVAILRRTDIDDPSYPSDWTEILSGTIDNFSVGQEKISFSVSDKLKSFQQPVCALIDSTSYPNAPTSSLGKRIPIAYNAIKGAPVIIVNETSGSEQYIFVDPNYYTNSPAPKLYDADGNQLTAGTDYNINASTGLVTMTGSASAQPETVDFSGISTTSGKLGNIIKDQIAAAAGITYISDNWDLTESGTYINWSPSPAFIFDGPDLKRLIAEALKNDMVYLITLPDGKLTFRHYFNDQIFTSAPFTTHYPLASLLTKFPSKKFGPSKNWLSTCVLESIDRQVVDQTFELQAESLYNRSRNRNFSCVLYVVGVVDEPARFAGFLAERFYLRREILVVALGESVLGIKLLDNVQMDVTINGRTFTRKTDFKVIGIDYGQDTLVLEET
jgi:hypothetical protein